MQSYVKWKKKKTVPLWQIPWYRVEQFFHKFVGVVEDIKQNDHLVLKKSFSYTQHNWKEY